MEKLGAPQLESVQKMSSDRLREKLLNQGFCPGYGQRNFDAYICRNTKYPISVMQGDMILTYRTRTINASKAMSSGV